MNYKYTMNFPSAAKTADAPRAMLRRLTLVLLLCTFSFLVNAQVITSPDKNFTMKFELAANGVPTYQLTYKKKPVIKESKLGMELKDAPSMMNGFTVSKSEQNSVNNTWEPILGEQKTIRNNYNELLVTLNQKEQKDRHIRIRFRLFNDGLGFRYEFPEQKELNYFII